MILGNITPPRDGQVQSQSHTEKAERMANTLESCPRIGLSTACPGVPRGGAPASLIPTGAQGWGCRRGAASRPSSLLPAHTPLMCPRFSFFSSACLRQEEAIVLLREQSDSNFTSEWINNSNIRQTKRAWAHDTWVLLVNNYSSFSPKQFSELLLKPSFIFLDTYEDCNAT